MSIDSISFPTKLEFRMYRIGWRTQVCMRIVSALVLAFMIGVLTRWFKIPVPAPPKLLGAVLILLVTSGYIVTDYYLTLGERSASTESVQQTKKNVTPTSSDSENADK